MKRVICFDLWGTIITSDCSEFGTYEDMLAKYWPRETIQRVVRDVLMTSERKQQVIDKAGNSKVSSYGEMVNALIQGLMTEKFSVNDFDFTQTEIVKLKNNIEYLWRMENERAEWIANAEQMLNILQGTDCKMVLVSNTTSRGWADVDRRLGIGVSKLFDRMFLSSEQPFAKPDVRVWEWVKQNYPDADEFWMVGNEQENDITVPRRMGWKTILVGRDGVPIADVPFIIQGGGSWLGI